MIFDSPKLVRLQKKYEQQPNFRVPQIVLLSRLEDYEEERNYLEGLIDDLPEEKRKPLLGRILSKNRDTHLGAWFELMVLGWLKNIINSKVDYEPSVEENDPDFLLDVGGKKIVIESSVILKNQATLKEERIISELFWVLKKIQRPYLIIIEDHNIKEVPNFYGFRQGVEAWLDSNPDNKFIHNFDDKSTIVLNSVFTEGKKNVDVIGSWGGSNVPVKPLKNKLKDKAKQHKNIRAAGFPYVICIMLESHEYDFRNVIEAWYGNLQVIIDTVSLKVIEQKYDLSGAHFFGKNIVRKSVSGTLIFKHKYANGKTDFDVAYLQNPYANQELSPDIFPVNHKWVLKGINKNGIQMGWHE